MDFETIKELDFKGVKSIDEPDRREFLKTLGGGIFFLFMVGDTELLEAQRRGRRAVDYNTILRIAEDGKVTFYTGRIEMGQGAITSLPQMLADELDVALDAVNIVMGDTSLCPSDGGTWVPPPSGAMVKVRLDPQPPRPAAC